jgi:chromosome segregation ATPase
MRPSTRRTLFDGTRWVPEQEWQQASAERDQLQATLARLNARCNRAEQAADVTQRALTDQRHEARRLIGRVEELKSQLAGERAAAIAREEALERERELWQRVWDAYGQEVRDDYPDLADDIEALPWMPPRLWTAREP